MREAPSISVIIPTLNSEKVLKDCLQSIRRQDYPPDKLKIIIIDGGSIDTTLDIAKEFTVDKILRNPLKTGESGKSVGVAASKSEILALIDSDNILDRSDWLKRMVEPFKDPEIVGSEHFRFIWRREDHFVNRYHALTGSLDPILIFVGNYSFYNTLTGRWTEMPVEETDRENYLKVKLQANQLPSIGTNGFLVKREEVLKWCSYQPYYFDIDIVHELVSNGKNKFAKVDVGVVHLFCDSIRTFIEKQKRRIKDYFFFREKGLRNYPWESFSIGYLKFILFTLLFFPLLYQIKCGYSKKPDLAWFFHVPGCLLTLCIYAVELVKAKLFRQTSMLARTHWGDWRK